MASTPAFSLAGIEAQVAMRREQEASAVAYTGTWSTWTDPALSGGSYTYANASGASVTTTIVGSGFALVARTGPEFGRARIYVDGVAEDIDLYAPSTRYQQVVVRKTLSHGTHTVMVEWTGTQNPASSGTYIGIDAIDVITGAPAGSAPTQTLSFDAANRVVGFTYDARGNVLADGTYTYTWDAYNHLTGVKLASTGALVATFAYDSDGMRQTATAGGVTTRFAVDAVSDEITALISATGVVVAQFIRDAAGALIAMVRSGAVFTYLTNAHGDVTALLNSAGAVVARWTYDAWGRPTEYNAAGTHVATGTAGNPFLYAGYFFDTATGLYYLRARYYDPATGRFLSMDPEPGRMSDRLSQNPYIYCQNDPVNLADPTGLRPDKYGGYGDNPTGAQQAAANKAANDARKRREEARRKKEEANRKARAQAAADDVRRLTVNYGHVEQSLSPAQEMADLRLYKEWNTYRAALSGTPLTPEMLVASRLARFAADAAESRAAYGSLRWGIAAHFFITQAYLTEHYQPGVVEIYANYPVLGASAKGNGNRGYADIYEKNIATGLGVMYEVKPDTHYWNNALRIAGERQLGRYVAGTRGASPGPMCQVASGAPCFAREYPDSPGMIYYGPPSPEGGPPGRSSRAENSARGENGNIGNLVLLPERAWREAEEQAAAVSDGLAAANPALWYLAVAVIIVAIVVLPPYPV